MAVDQAERRAAALGAGGDDQPAGGDGDAGPDAAGTDVVGSAAGTAGFSFVSFAAGGRHPDPAVPRDHGDRGHPGRRHRRRGGAVRNRGDGRGADRRIAAGPGLRQLGIGVAAAVVTYGLGRLFGTTIG
jgi:hypothetical protein